MAETHVNAYRQDVEEAFGKLTKELADTHDAVNRLLAKIDQDNEVAAPATEPLLESEPVPEVESKGDFKEDKTDRKALK